MKINRHIVESYINKKVEIKLFDGTTLKGYLHKTGEERYKNNPNLYFPKNYYFLEHDNYDHFGYKNHSCLIRSSHIKNIKEVK